MTYPIRPADFEDPALEAFLHAHLAEMAPHSPEESRHALDMTALQQPGVRLWVAWHDRRIAGTCASAVLEFFAPARALYARHGFEPCPPFGSYTEDPHSTFMTRALAGA